MTKRFLKVKWEGMSPEDNVVPLSKQLKPNELLVFMAIAMTQNQFGESDITIKQLLERLPIGSNKTVQTAVEGLLEFRYEGEPIITKSKKTGINGKEQNVYTVHNNPLFCTYGEESFSVNTTHNDEPLSVNFTHTKENMFSKELKDIKNTEEESNMTSKEVVSYFYGLLKEKGIDKRPHYPRLMSQMKKIEPMFSDMINNDIKKVCEIINENYDSWNSNSQYPLEASVIGRVWVWERAMKELEKEKEQESQIESQSVVANERTKVGLSSIMSRIKKKEGK